MFCCSFLFAGRPAQPPNRGAGNAAQGGQHAGVRCLLQAGKK